MNMSDISSSTAENKRKRQHIIAFDVGGEIFKMSEEDVRRYPQSLLARMVDDFPELVEARQPLPINRNPERFECIRQIYRGACGKIVIPSMTAEELQDELDFYQLPSIIDLGVTLQWKKPFSKKPHAIDLADGVYSEIMSSGLENFFPWRVYIYYKCTNGELDQKPKVFVEPMHIMTRLIDRRGHTEFYRAHTANSTQSTRAIYPDQKICLKENGSNTTFICRFMNDEFFEDFQAAMKSNGLKCSRMKENNAAWSDQGKLEYYLVD